MALDPVVVVEDHPLHGRFLRRALEARLHGRPVELFDDGVAAARRLHDLRRPAPALLVLDLDLPGRSGHELLGECSCDPRLAPVPAAIVTSSPVAEAHERSLALGATVHLAKPEDPSGFELLADRLAGLLG